MLAQDIIGNQTIRNLLEDTVRQGRISHAQLFASPEGVGVLPIAIAYAAGCWGWKKAKP